jgi:hypothetical protein
MNAQFPDFECPIRWGPSATPPPMEPSCGNLAAMLLLAGTIPQRPRALPAHRITAHSGPSLVKHAGWSHHVFIKRASPLMKRSITLGVTMAW